MKPERDQNNRESRKKNWWLFGETNPKLRRQLGGLPRYIATVETAKHRLFQFLDATILPDNMLVAIASADALHLGILSSQVHSLWALAAGGTLEDRPRYNKTRCFETYPFPDADSGLTASIAERIRTLADQIDGHRKAQQVAHADATLTATYNVFEKLRAGETLNAKDKVVHEHGLVGVLKSLHDELDAAVLQAYGWADLTLPADVDALLVRLVELNAKRAAEEAGGTVRWLRPEFQKAGEGVQSSLASDGEADEAEETATAEAPVLPVSQRPWAAGITEQIKSVAEVLQGAGRPLDLASLAGHFNGRGRWRDRLPTLLDTLVALGRAREVPGGWIDAGS